MEQIVRRVLSAVALFEPEHKLIQGAGGSVSCCSCDKPHCARAETMSSFYPQYQPPMPRFCAIQNGTAGRFAKIALAHQRWLQPHLIHFPKCRRLLTSGYRPPLQ